MYDYIINNMYISLMSYKYCNTYENIIGCIICSLFICILQDLRHMQDHFNHELLLPYKLLSLKSSMNYYYYTCPKEIDGLEINKNLRKRVLRGGRRNLFPRKSPKRSKSKSNRGIHMSAGDMSDSVNHDHDNEAARNGRAKLGQLPLIMDTQCRRPACHKHNQVSSNQLCHNLHTQSENFRIYM